GSTCCTCATCRAPSVMLPMPYALPESHPRRHSTADELPELLANLRSSVTRHVGERRAAGVPIARVIPEVRCLVREAESCESVREPSDALLAQVIRWTVAAYF